MIAQVLVSVMLSGSAQAAPAVPAAEQAAAPAATAEKVCRRERLTGSNVRQTVCVDKQEAERVRSDGQQYLEAKREQFVTSRGGAVERPR